MTEGALFSRLALLGRAALALAPPAGARPAYPSRPITLVVPFPAGGSTDLVARVVAEKMSQDLGQQIVVENRGGAGGNLGSAAVAKADPDGYTILMGTVATHALNPALYKKMPYDPVADFAPISLLVVVPNVLVVNRDFPAKNVAGADRPAQGRARASTATPRPATARRCICRASCSRAWPASTWSTCPTRAPGRR